MSKWIKNMLREGLVLEFFNQELDVEHQNIPFTRTRNDDNYITYKYEISGLDYYTDIIKSKDSGLPSNTFTVLFGYEGQNGSSDSAGKGPSHLKKVLYTTARIMDIECQEKHIKYYNSEGFPTDIELQNDPMGSTKRSRIYEKFFSEYYSPNVLIVRGRYIFFQMDKVYPEIFKEVRETTKSHQYIAKLLGYINNDNPNLDVWDTIDGYEDDFTVSTDEIINKSYGGLDLDITINMENDVYSINYNKFDIGEKDQKQFNDFKSLYYYMKENLENVRAVNQK